jgi:putative PIN family toxin of toxin-antitoxin system
MKPDVIDVILDTNVLLTALKSSKGTSFRLLSMVVSGRFQLHISAPLVAEYEAVLKRGFLTLSDAQIDDVIDYVCAQATHHKIFYLWRPTLKDPGDDFVLELAVKASARIITWNVKDFSRANMFNVSVQTPREFLNFLENHP